MASKTLGIAILLALIGGISAYAYVLLILLFGLAVPTCLWVFSIAMVFLALGLLYIQPLLHFEGKKKVIGVVAALLLVFAIAVGLWVALRQCIIR